jgi:flagellar biosynthesis chaperone FliJ
LRAETERTHESMDVAKADWAIAARRVEALERLAERIAEAEKVESARLAANEIDDLVLARRGRDADITIAGDAA